jgi:hypothetical protein
MKKQHIGREEVEAVIREVLRRSAVDGEFRALAVTDGNAAMRSIDRNAVPEGTVYCFADNSGKRKTIPLPDLVETSDELCEEDLEQVAGGCDIASCASTLS